MFRVAMISRWHPHAVEDRYVNQLKEIPDTAVSCVWDDDQPRGRAWAEELGVAFEPDLDALLRRENVDGICITAPTNRHKEIILKAAAAGKHVFTEKALAMNGAEAREVRQAVEQSGIRLGLAFPRRANREYLYAKKLYDAGAFGQAALMRIRNAVTNRAVFAPHWFKAEPVGGGGAIRDLGCHNIDLACWILGEPDSVSVTLGHVRGFDVDDTGVCNLTFPCGAIAMLDSTFSAPLCGNWYSFELYGSKLAFLSDTEQVTLIHADGSRERFPIAELEPGYPLPLHQWVNACTGQGENLCDVAAGERVNRVLDAAARAMESHRTEPI